MVCGILIVVLIEPIRLSDCPIEPMAEPVNLVSYLIETLAYCGLSVEPTNEPILLWSFGLSDSLGWVGLVGPIAS